MCLFPLPQLQRSFFLLKSYCLSAQLRGIKRKKQLGDSSRSACWVVVLGHARVKLLYNHSLLHCPQNSFMSSWVNLTVCHPLLYRAKYKKKNSVVLKKRQAHTEPIISVLTYNWVNSWLKETWNLLQITFSQKSVILPDRYKKHSDLPEVT